MSKSQYEVGMKRLHDILGAGADQIIENFKQVSPDFAKYVVEFGYGDLYTRSGISDKYRELAAVEAIQTAQQVFDSRDLNQ